MQRLRAVFGRYFGDAPKRDADEYHRQPEMIANYVYMDEFRKYKMGNVNEGDGWLFQRTWSKAINRQGQLY